MFGIGTTELIIIFAILLLVFGASRLPALGKGLGQGIRSFRDAMRELNAKDDTDGGDVEKTGGKASQTDKQADQVEGKKPAE